MPVLQPFSTYILLVLRSTANTILWGAQLGFTLMIDGCILRLAIYLRHNGHLILLVPCGLYDHSYDCESAWVISV